jgi:hypothetical protein
LNSFAGAGGKAIVAEQAKAERQINIFKTVFLLKHPKTF